MNDSWWDSIYECAAMDMNDAYIQRLIDEFKYLSDHAKTHDQNGSPEAPPLGDETS